MSNLSRDTNHGDLSASRAWLVALVFAVLGASIALLVNQIDGYGFLVIGFAGVLTLGVLMVCFNRIRTVLLLVAFFLPVEMVPWATEVYRDLDLTTPILLVALLYLGLIALTAGQARLRRTPIDVAILVFIAVQVIIIILSPWTIDTLIRYLKYNKVFVLYYLLVTYLRSKEDILTAVKLYISSAILVAVYGLAAFAIFVATGRQLWGLGFSWGYLPRIYGTMRDQNIFAAYMITPVLLLTSAFLLTKARFKKLSFAVAIGIVLLAMLFTWSRSGFLGLAVAAMTYMFLNRQYAIRIFSRVVPMGFAILLFLGLAANIIGYSPLLLVQRFTGYAYGTDQSDQMHYYIARLGLETFLSHPIGVGRSNILRYVGATSTETQGYFIGMRGMNSTGEIDGIYQGWPMHSSWLEILVAEGIIGFIAFLMIVGKTIRFGTRAARRTPDPTVHFVLVSFVSGFVGILASAIFYTFDWMYFFWFVIAMIMTLSLHVGHTEWLCRVT